MDMDSSDCEHGGKEAFECANKLTSYMCKKCDFKTELKIILNKHTHNNCQKTDPFDERNYICNNCNFTSHSILVSYTHQRSSKCDNGVKQQKLETTSHKNIDNSLSCKFCEYKSNIYNGLKEHYLIHHPDKIYECNQSTNKWCLTKHPDLEHLLQHFKCQHCSYKTIYKANLKLHILSRHTKPEEIKWYECTQCNYKAKRNECLKRHIEEVHTDKANRKMYECSQCSFKTINRSTHYAHKKKHSDFKPYQCIQCSFQSYDRSKLKRHINSRHAKAEEIEWFYCDQCDFKTKRKCRIGPHIAKHSKVPSFEYREKIRRYKCDQCYYKTDRLQYLTDHRLTKHTDPSEIEHWYECDQCDYKAKIRRTLFRHVKDKHRANKK